MLYAKRIHTIHQLISLLIYSGIISLFFWVGNPYYTLHGYVIFVKKNINISEIKITVLYENNIVCVDLTIILWIEFDIIFNLHITRNE